MEIDLLNYDDEQVVASPPVITIDSSPEPSLDPSLVRIQTHMQTSPRVRRTPKKPHPRRASYTTNTVPSKQTTPPLAMIDTYPDHPFSPVSSHMSTPHLSSTAPSELSFTERNLVIMAIQEQTDWTAIMATTGIPVEKLLRWWMKASSEIVKRG